MSTAQTGTSSRFPKIIDIRQHIIYTTFGNDKGVETDPKKYR